jgi:hypothetical protein
MKRLRYTRQFLGVPRGAGWALWDRRQHDPWLRLLQQARARLQAAGLDLPAHAPPRRMREALRQSGDPIRTEALQDWLLQMESQRYAADPALSLAALRRRFRHLPWPDRAP